MSELTLAVVPRKAFGSRRARKALAAGKIFANIYGHGLESIAVEGDHKEVTKIVHQAGYNKPLQLSMDGHNYDCLIGELDVDPLTQNIRHVGFRVVKRDEKVTTEVPIHFLGEPPALRRGLIMVTVIDKLNVEAIPAKIPEFIEVDTSILEEDDQAIRVQDLKASEDYKVLDEAENVIVKVEMPKEEVVEEVPVAEEEAEAAETGAETPVEGSETSEESANKE